LDGLSVGIGNLAKRVHNLEVFGVF
jgi:hypothetical protein